LFISSLVQGMLTKKGRNLGFGLGFWRTTRLYTLTDTALSFTDKSKKNVKAHHLVESFKTVTRMPSRRWPNRCFSLLFEDNKIFHLRAPTVTECTDWIDSLARAIANAEKRKARWRFVRENAQMQQVQQMNAMGAAYFSPVQQAQAMDMSAMGMVPMSLSPPMTSMPPMLPPAMQLHPMLAMQYAQQMQMMPLHPVGPMGAMPIQMSMPYDQQFTPGIAPMEAQLPPAMAAMQPRAKPRSRTNLVDRTGGLQRIDSRSSRGSSSKGKSSAPPGAAPSTVIASGASGSDAEMHTEEDEDEAEGADGLSDEFVSGEEEPEDEADGDQYYDEDADGGEYYAAAPQAPMTAFPPFNAQQAAAARAFASWTHAQQQQQLADAALAAQQQQQFASQFNPEDQFSLNAQKEKIGWVLSLWTVLAGSILLLGHEGRTGAQVFALLSGLFSGAASSPLSALPTLNGTLSNATVASVSGAGSLLSPLFTLFSSLRFTSRSLPSGVRPSYVVALALLLLTVYFFMALKKEKSRQKKRRAAEKAAKAKEQAEAAAAKRAGKPAPASSSVTNAAQQAAVWKEQSNMLAKELAITTRKMSMLAASAAAFVAAAAYACMS
jgi:hypothetical protein